MALLNQPTVIFTKYTIVLKSIDAVLLLDSGWGYAGGLPTCYNYRLSNIEKKQYGNLVENPYVK